jgi:hypothetical protein
MYLNLARGAASVITVEGILDSTDFGARYLAAVSYDQMSLDGAPGTLVPPRPDPE